MAVMADHQIVTIISSWCKFRFLKVYKCFVINKALSCSFTVVIKDSFLIKCHDQERDYLNFADTTSNALPNDNLWFHWVNVEPIYWVIPLTRGSFTPCPDNFRISRRSILPKHKLMLKLNEILHIYIQDAMYIRC